MRILIEVVVSLLLIALEPNTIDDQEEGEIDEIEGHLEQLDPLPSRVTHHVEVVLYVCHKQHNEGCHLHHLENLTHICRSHQDEEMIRIVECNETKSQEDEEELRATNSSEMSTHVELAAACEQVQED